MAVGVFLASAGALLVMVGLAGRVIVWVIERRPK
jgi:hypothetical protein